MIDFHGILFCFRKILKNEKKLLFYATNDFFKPLRNNVTNGTNVDGCRVPMTNRGVGWQGTSQAVPKPPVSQSQ